MQPSPMSPREKGTVGFPKSSIKVLLLENVSKSAEEALRSEGYQVQCLAKLSPEELCSAIEDVHVIGVRSKTKLTADVLSHAKKLLAIGCFCIGTDQTDLAEAQEKGIPVFNAPFSNTRSVAELTLANIVNLSRKLADHSKELHEGNWNKTAKGCHEIRGKTLGVVGYGHVGSQVSVLAESFGMKVLYFDIVPKLPLGNAQRAPSLEHLLAHSDYVTLHVPLADDTKNMINRERIAEMKDGAFLINASRGSVVDVAAAAEALRSGHLAGAAFDVYPDEPAGNGKGVFTSPLQGCPNTILTPHIGGSTEEAQWLIGEEVSLKLIKFINEGATTGAVNFPNLELPPCETVHRILNIHKNVPGVMRTINTILGDFDSNILAQSLGTRQTIGYMITDFDAQVGPEIKARIDAELPANIRTRLLV